MHGVALARRAVRESLVLLKNERRVLPLARTGRVLVVGTGATDDGAYARVVGPEGGTVEVPNDIEGLAGIAGSSINVPASALPCTR